MLDPKQLWFGILIAWLAVWLWSRYQGGTLKLKYFKFWGDVPEKQKKDNRMGFGVTAVLLVVNLATNLF